MSINAPASRILSAGWFLLLLSFHEMTPAQTPFNDQFASSFEISGERGEVSGSNVGATVEPGEPRHAGMGRSSVWWHWSPSVDGMATFDTFWSDFDTVLAVYTGPSVSSLHLVAENDDSSESFQSSVEFRAEVGRVYRIAVGGFDTATGYIRLAWRLDQELLPPVGCASAPVISSAAGLRKGSGIVQRQERILYGEDDRREVYEETDPNILETWEATGALIDSFLMTDNGDGTWSLDRTTLQESFRYEGVNLCSDEPYANQPSVASCSGFLVGADVVATAGHCIESGFWRELYFVLGFRMLDPDTAVCTVPDSMVYRFESLVGWDLDYYTGADWGLLKLDREVRDVRPLKIRGTGQVAKGDDLIVIGHPLGLPAKIADNGSVIDARPTAYFVSDLDTYGGNSGSAVLNARTLEVEGILVRGEYPEFVYEGDCVRSRVCRPGECTGEDVTRSSEFSHLLGFALFVRGDSNGDGIIDINDAEYTLGYLYKGRPEPGCLDAADANDDGSVDTTDPVFTMTALVMGRMLPAPYPLCGVDPTPDELLCEQATGNCPSEVGR